MAGGWLLDVNVPWGLVLTLAGFGIEADTAAARGWKELTNGRLVEEAHKAGVSAILTRDRRFGLAASQTLIRFPAIGLVIVAVTASSRDTVSVQFCGGLDDPPDHADSREDNFMAMIGELAADCGAGSAVLLQQPRFGMRPTT